MSKMFLTAVKTDHKHLAVQGTRGEKKCITNKKYKF